VAYQISYRQLDEMMEERGVEVEHSTLNRWVVKYAPLLERQFRARKRPVGASWRLDQTSHGGLRVKEFKSLIHE
jgi:transposase-like protein